MIKVLHYLNQFFAGIGGEEKAGQEVIFLPQAVGIGVEIERSLQAARRRVCNAGLRRQLLS